jgi:ribonuclease HII
MLNRYMNKEKIEAGIDEAGRGPLLGRVYTASVILTPEEDDFNHSLMRDSKKLSERKRLMAFDYIKEFALDYAVSYRDEKNIDEINIREATLGCMHDSLKKLQIIPDHILVDGNAFYCYPDPRDSDSYIEHTCVVKGDDKYTSIAAASILAKVSRDKHIEEICDKYPILDEYYNISKNKGYGAKVHMDGIRKYGVTKFHRRSFGLCGKSKLIDIN